MIKVTVDYEKFDRRKDKLWLERIYIFLAVARIIKRHVTWILILAITSPVLILINYIAELKYMHDIKWLL